MAGFMLLKRTHALKGMSCPTKVMLYILVQLSSLIEKIPSTKIHKSQTMFWSLKNWDLRFVWNLMLEIWDLINLIFEKEDL